MPANHTDVDQFPTVVKTSNGDPADQTAWRSADEPLADRTHFLRVRTYGAQVDDFVQARFVPFLNDTDIWTQQVSPFGWTQSSVAAGYALYFEVDVPKNCKITSCVVKLFGQGHAALPATMPRLRLFSQDTGSTGAPTTVGDQSDTTATFAAFDLMHEIVISGLTEVVSHDGGARYYIRIDGETGANSAVGLTVTDAYIVVSPS